MNLLFREANRSSFKSTQLRMSAEIIQLTKVSYRKLLWASWISFTKLYEKPSQAPTSICLARCAILASSTVGSWDWNFVIQTNPWITNFLLLAISSHRSRSGTHEARQWDCSRFISVVRGSYSLGPCCDIFQIKNLAVSKCFRMIISPIEDAWRLRKCIWQQRHGLTAFDSNEDSKSELHSRKSTGFSIVTKWAVYFFLFCSFWLMNVPCVFFATEGEGVVIGWHASVVRSWLGRVHWFFLSQGFLWNF
jgi:hypothetical protein